MSNDKIIQYYYTNINIWKCFTPPHHFSEIQIKNSERNIILKISQPYPITQIGNKNQQKLINKELKKLNKNKPYKLNCLI